MSKKERWLRERTTQVIYTRLKLLALNMFEWKGLPKGMRPEYIERILYSKGKAVFFNDPDQGLVVMEAQCEGQPNVYGEWTSVRPTSRNGVAFDEYIPVGKDQNCVLIRNNALYLQTDFIIEWFTAKLVEIEMSLDSNVKMQKFPFFISATDKNILTLKNIVKKIEDDEIAIYADKSMRGEIEVLQTGVPFICDKLGDYKNFVWNDALTFLGIENANTDKRERLNTDEVNANNMFTELSVECMLQARQFACEEINRLFKTNISVEVRRGEDGTIHPGTKTDNRE